MLIVAIYTAKQTNYIFSRFRIISLQDVENKVKSQWLSHSIYPNSNDETDLNVLIGNDQCSHPYNTCILNIGSMNTFQPKKENIQAMKDRNLGHSKNSWEERLHAYCMASGDLVWQIGPDFMGCRSENGNFNSKSFKEMASRQDIKMIELTLSPRTEFRRPIDLSLDNGKSAKIERSDSIFPGLSYATFTGAEGMLHFLNSLRELSGGKPVGIRICINRKKEFHEICYTIRKTHVIPDFITVEGSFESTNTDPIDKEIHSGMPLYEALLFVSQTLQLYGLEKEIKIIAVGKIVSSFDILKLLALGANAVCSEMHGNSSLKYPGNDRKANSFYKGQNSNEFHNNLMKATIQAMKICGFMNVDDITLSKFFHRLDVLHSNNFGEVNGPILYPGTVRKIYNSKKRSYQMQDEREGKGLVDVIIV
jgi:hypothetical protein